MVTEFLQSKPTLTIRFDGMAQRTPVTGEIQ
jgi:hypothetical protein